MSFGFSNSEFPVISISTVNVLFGAHVSDGLSMDSGMFVMSICKFPTSPLYLTEPGVEPSEPYCANWSVISA